MLSLSVTGRVFVCVAVASFVLIVAGLISFAISEEPLVQHRELKQQPTLGIISSDAAK